MLRFHRVDRTGARGPLTGLRGVILTSRCRRSQVTAAVREEIEELQKRLNIDAPLHVESGEAARTVCDVAADLETDLLVIGRGSAAGVFGRLRANAYSIIRQGRCPVVSV